MSLAPNLTSLLKKWAAPTSLRRWEKITTPTRHIQHKHLIWWIYDEYLTVWERGCNTLNSLFQCVITWNQCNVQSFVQNQRSPKPAVTEAALWPSERGFMSVFFYCACACISLLKKIILQSRTNAKRIGKAKKDHDYLIFKQINS